MLTRAALLLLISLASAATIARVGRTEPRHERAALATLPLDIGEWRGRNEAPFDGKTLAVLGVDDYLTRTYVDADGPVGVYVGYWASQQQGDTMHSPLNCLPGSGWEPISKRALDVRVPDGAAGEREVAINRYLVERAGDRELVLYWYQGRGRVVANEYLSRIFQVADAVRFHRSDGAIVRLMIHAPPEDAGARAAERLGSRFVAALFPWLGHSLPS